MCFCFHKRNLNHGFNGPFKPNDASRMVYFFSMLTAKPDFLIGFIYENVSSHAFVNAKQKTVEGWT